MAETGEAEFLRQETDFLASEATTDSENAENSSGKDPLTIEKSGEENQHNANTNLKSPGGDSNISTTSLLGSLKLEDEDDGETRDLFVFVDDAEKHISTLDTYVSYRVTTKTTRGSFDKPEFSVRRRYQDFLWLRRILEETLPNHIVPPLPEKHSLRIDRFNPEFIKARQAALQKFLQRISDHPVLSFNDHFYAFLTAKELSSRKKQGVTIIRRMGDSVRMAAASYMLKKRSPEFTTMNDYVQLLGEKLGIIDRVVQRLIKENAEYYSDLREFGPVFSLWSNSEVELSDTLNSLASCVEKWAESLRAMNEEQELEFLPLIKEYFLYIEAIKTVLKKRDAVQMEYELALEELNRKKSDREQVKISDQTYSVGAIFSRKDPTDVRQEKGAKLDKQIEELQAQVEDLNDKAECANADLGSDMDHWHHNKAKDVKEMMTDMATRQISYYDKVLASWEEVIVKMKHQVDLRNQREEAALLESQREGSGDSAYSGSLQDGSDLPTGDPATSDPSTSDLPTSDPVLPTQ